ncbi:uncharacterized protein LOC8023308 [Ixodes scapularis]|uniref:uncharacterized protein LOC8023308 n=1 Tax=Ixodes scapularis TaxID=6945 RepID=UPI001A9D76A0|nr:uncharacterized protein LOC8023308 [Ixodes scapularis]
MGYGLSQAVGGLAVLVLLVAALEVSGQEAWSNLQRGGVASEGGPGTSSSSSSEDRTHELLAFKMMSRNIHPDFKTASAKRSTMLLSKLMQPLFKAYKNDADGGFSSQMELQRRGEGKMYWKCYFNAVSCFRRK